MSFLDIEILTVSIGFNKTVNICFAFDIALLAYVTDATQLRFYMLLLWESLSDNVFVK